MVFIKSKYSSNAHKAILLQKSYFGATRACMKEISAPDCTDHWEHCNSYRSVCELKCPYYQRFLTSACMKTCSSGPCSADEV